MGGAGGPSQDGSRLPRRGMTDGPSASVTADGDDAADTQLVVTHRDAGPLREAAAGPLVPGRLDALGRAERNFTTGRLEALSDVDMRNFEAQRRTFHNFGYAQSPEDASLVIGDRRAAREGGGASVLERRGPAMAGGKRERLSPGDAGDLDGFRGPWAGYVGEHIGEESRPTAEQVARFEGRKEARAVHRPARRGAAVAAVGEEYSTFDGVAERDYLGRSYVEAPLDLGMRLDREAGSFECFTPKALIHTWSGHAKGVNAIRFFPTSGHLLLSAGQDGKVKLWDVHHERQRLRTFHGHSRPVRDICFDHDGRHFASCSYDKTVKYWDTESGKCTFAKEHSDIPYCVRIHPDPALGHIVLAGTADQRIVQWDVRSGDVVQEYREHLGAVNSITFFDGNRRFVSSSDDKSLRVWDYDIPVTVKAVSEADMHSMPCAVAHPLEPLIAFQSLDNTIQVYTVQDRFKSRHKKFTGHTSAGYACQMTISPDGQYIASGDGGGQAVIWDWKTGRIVKRLNAHRRACICVAWNPQEPSRLATCGWDGAIKYWD